MAQKAVNGIQQVVQGLADNFAPVLERLAGTESDLKLRFEDLVLDTGKLKTKLSGELLLSATYSKPVAESNDERLVSQTVVKNVNA